MPRIDATDRSISPLMMISVIGSVMIAISPLDRPRLNRLLPVRKSGEATEPMATMRMTTTARPVSQRSADWSRADRSRGPAGQGPGGRPSRARLLHDADLRLRQRALVRRSVMVWSRAMATSSSKPQIAWSQNEEMPST